MVDIENEDRRGLTSVFYIRCQHCLFLNRVPTSKQHNANKQKLYDINLKAVLG